MKLSLSILVVLSMSMTTLASTKNEQKVTNVYNSRGNGKGKGSPKGNNQGNNQVINFAPQKGPDVTLAPTVALPRSLKSLFVRDPDFEFAMGVLARNADTAERTVDQIVANIKKGTVHPLIEQAALARKLIVKAPSKMRRFLGLEARDVDSSLLHIRAPIITGPKGMSHPVDHLAQHITSGGYIPPKIIDALTASKHYLRPGQKSSNPTAAPKGKKGQKAQAASSDKRPMGAGRKGPSPVQSRDLEGLYARDIPDIFTRDLERFQARDMSELYTRAAEAGVTHEELKALVKATQDNPDAEKAVYHALTMDPNVEKVTEDLIRDWANTEDLGKRDAYADGELEAREAEPEAEPEAEAEAEAEADAEAAFSMEWEA